jgi:beta-glucanase (GH16 family)
MYRILFVFLLAALPVLPATDWKLIWSDEFNGPENSAPDPAKWAYDLGAGGWGNHELEAYTKNPENVFEDGKGHLAIRAAKSDTGRITSARIKTDGKFAIKYGKVEARIKIPYGQGIWPAFWMLGDNISTVGWPQCGEIDVMENIGKEPSTVHGTVHGPGYSGKDGISAAFSSPGGAPFSADFHIYSIEWSPESIQFLVDGAGYARVTAASLPKDAVWVYNRPFFLLLNLAVGGSWPGNPDATTVFPQTMLVDWVRVSEAAK